MPLSAFLEVRIENRIALSTFSYFDTGNAALAQILDRDYAADLRAEGVTGTIYEYGFTFEGKKLLIAEA